LSIKVDILKTSYLYTVFTVIKVTMVLLAFIAVSISSCTNPTSAPDSCKFSDESKHKAMGNYMREAARTNMPIQFNSLTPRTTI
jgi:hypothetical protein